MRAASLEDVYLDIVRRAESGEELTDLQVLTPGASGAKEEAR